MMAASAADAAAPCIRFDYFIAYAIYMFSLYLIIFFFFIVDVIAFRHLFAIARCRDDAAMPMFLLRRLMPMLLAADDAA